jgi:iron complex transport system ATP-binding protein
MKIVELENIEFSYIDKSNYEDFELSNLNLEINEKDFISVIGPNGSGKSTLVKIIANIYLPKSGNAKLYGKEFSFYSKKEFAKNIAYVPQNNNTQFPFSVFEIVMMGRSPHLNFWGIEKDADHKLVIDILDILEISHLKDKGINEISGGEAQRALIARALTQKPKILLLDEPNAYLDIKHQLSIFELLKKYNVENDLTVVFISHDFNLSSHFCNRTLLMQNGQIIFDDKPKNVLTEENIKLVFGVNSKVIHNEYGDGILINLTPNK